MRLSVPQNARTILLTLVMAGAAALMAVAFLLATHWAFELTFVYYATQSDGFFLVASFVTIMSCSLAVGLLMNFVAPRAAGSGIPQLKAAYWKDTGVVALKDVVVKFVAGVLSIGGGLSLGREGPTLFMGGGLASNIAGWFKVPRHLRRPPAAVGASASLAAAFNTPLAAITFVLEEILGDLSSKALGRMILASVMGAFVVYACIGPQPAFSLPPVNSVSWVHYLVLPVVALVTALVGVVFQRSILGLRAKVKGHKILPQWSLPMVGGLVTWVLGVAVYLNTRKLGVFSLGYGDLSDVLNNHFLWWVAGILVAAKLVATVVSYSFGGCGGVFSPLLFLGGLGGYFVAGLASLWIPLTPEDTMALAATGMATCLGTVLRTPLSCLLIVFEMTHQFSMVPGLLLGLLISTLVAKLAGPHNFYDALLVQDGHHFHQIHPPTDFQSWKEQPVGALATPRPVTLDAGSPEQWAAVVEAHPYRVFPVVRDGAPLGVVFRERGDPVPVPVFLTSDPLEAAEARFLETSAGVVLVVDERGALTGILTLHDLLRAQASLGD